MVREIGGIEAKEDRVVVFPNMFQHHVDPFELKDKTKPGHRKILCFSLLIHTIIMSLVLIMFHLNKKNGGMILV